MKISNRTKDKIMVLTFIMCLLVLIVMVFVAVVNLFSMDIQAAEQLTETQQYNKFITEERIKAELYYNSVCELIDNMSDEEYYNTFFGGNNEEI